MDRYHHHQGRHHLQEDYLRFLTPIVITNKEVFTSLLSCFCFIDKDFTTIQYVDFPFIIPHLINL